MSIEDVIEFSHIHQHIVENLPSSETHDGHLENIFDGDTTTAWNNLWNKEGIAIAEDYPTNFTEEEDSYFDIEFSK